MSEEQKEKKRKGLWWKARIVILSTTIVLASLVGIAWAAKWGAYKGYPVARLMINSEIKNPGTPAINIHGRVYVPLRYISENLGANVGWDQENQTVKITSGTTTTTNPPATKKWVNVTTLSGSTEKTGGLFTLSGAQARLVYEVNGDPVFCAIYVMKEGTSLDKDGGIPKATIMESKSDTTMLIKDAGNYYLAVNAANCNWTATVQEYK